MFRALLCPSSGGQLYWYSIWYRHCLSVTVQYTGYDRTAVLFSTQVTRGLQSSSVHRLRQDCSPVQYTGYQRTAVQFSTQVTTGLQSSGNLCTEQSPNESDYTRCCVDIVVLLKMSTIVLEICRRM